MKPPRFSVTYDYRCPFARNAHEHLVAGLRDGAGWDVELVPFSLSQAHIEEGGRPVWEDPSKKADLLAMEASIVVKERFAEKLLDVHLAMFAARHDEGKDLREEKVVREVLQSNGLDADEVLSALEEGWASEAFRKSHETAVAEPKVFGVPTFIMGDQAVFVRLMTRPGDDTSTARSTIDHVLGLLVEHPELNEYKHTSINR